MAVAWRLAPLAFVAAAVLSIPFSSRASAASCGEITYGAKQGSQYTEDDGFSAALLAKYKDACIVRWQGGSRGHAGRVADEQKCKGLPGAEFLEFHPDRGSNFNTCIFRALGASAGARRHGGRDRDRDVEAPPARPWSGPRPRYDDPPPRPGRDGNGVVTFKLTNRAKHTIHVKFFARIDKEEWGEFRLDDRRQQSFRLRCKIPQKICYGAYYRDHSLVWGTGPDGRKGCSNCCLECDTVERNVYLERNLTD